MHQWNEPLLNIWLLSPWLCPLLSPPEFPPTSCSLNEFDKGCLAGGSSSLTHILDSVKHQHGLIQNQEENSFQDSIVLVRLVRRRPL